MKRLLGVTIISLLAAGLLIVSPASAGNDACAGQGEAVTQSNVYYPGLGPSATGTVTFTFTIGGCNQGHSNTANGNFTAGVAGAGNFCGSSTGDVSIDHHNGSWTSAGSMLVLSGGINGAVNAVPNATKGDSCTSGANDFLVTGSVALV
ncbi:MAG TPA: hypothetical protein VF230_16125 [Acidimicrobiales bacterium]